ncbi:Interferon-activable protein [Quillaja saponaria]|uniref:Interferon-activable protein n=1 Tax=Quillaja saponaria TaxID=32244 RepID=A0AAD7L0B9_QUISA|nr:Interferon-activable protein [Quillaja saponaria]
MEPAKIDWKRIESKFVEDQLFEHINAPKWVDFLAPDDPIDDEAWFCRPGCKHPKKAEDFLRSTPSKLLRSADASETLPLGDQNRRDVRFKRRVPTQSSISPNGKLKFNQDSENHDPNLYTPPNYQLKSPLKAPIKSSTEKNKPIDDIQQSNEAPSLKSTLSARNLFAGRDILNRITEFCNELKNLATRARERENAENLSDVKSQEGKEKDMVKAVPVQALSDVKSQEEKEKDMVKAVPVQALSELNREKTGRKPLLEVSKANRLEGSTVKGKQQRNKRADEAENTPISLDLGNVRGKREDTLLQIRTNPPSPQCFSATGGPTTTTPSKASKSRLMERGILQEIEQNKEVPNEESVNKGKSVSIVDRREARTLDVFWFLKPCTISS